MDEQLSRKIKKVRNAMLAVQRYPWEQGVCMQALWEAGDTETAAAMAHDAVLRQLPDGRLAVTGGTPAVTDPAANGPGVKRAYELTGDEMYLRAAERMLGYLMKDAPRTENGILCHNEVSFHGGFTEKQIWADSIYMAPPFLAEMGRIDEAYRQIKGMYRYLIDEKTGLLRHIYDAGSRRFVRDKRWATGNGWALMGMASVTDTAAARGRKDIADDLFTLSKGLLDCMLKYQLADGRFHDILDDDCSFIDGTGAMMAAVYIYRSIAGGMLPETCRPFADRTAETIEKYVDSFGIIHGVCGCPDFIREGTSAESMAAYIMMHAWKERSQK